jgi:16S rRNA (uracil1498-N3)-methyltransferase
VDDAPARRLTVTVPAGTPPTPAGAGAAAQVFVADLDQLDLDADDAHHLGQVLRLRPGEGVVAADGAGHWRPCRFTGSPAHPDDRSPLEAVGPVRVVPRPVPLVTVGFVPVKATRPEWVVQKLTESGVDRIAVLASARSVVRWSPERRSRAVERLGRVAREAAAQCRRAWLPAIVGASNIEDLVALLAPEPLALAHPGGEPPSLRAPAVAVGPEGGWDPHETGAAAALVGLGSTVLRAETATVAAGLLLCALRDGIVAPVDRAQERSRREAGT